MSILQIMFREFFICQSCELLSLHSLLFLWPQSEPQSEVFDLLGAVPADCPSWAHRLRQGRWVATPENLRVLAQTLLEVCMHMAPWLPWLHPDSLGVNDAELCWSKANDYYESKADDFGIWRPQSEMREVSWKILFLSSLDLPLRGSLSNSLAIARAVLYVVVPHKWDVHGCAIYVYSI